MDNKIFEHHKICDDVKNLDKKIQFVSVINADVNLIRGGINGESTIQNKKFLRKFSVKCHN